VVCPIDPADGRTVEISLSTWTLVLVETE
jgi:hypothetical protein